MATMPINGKKHLKIFSFRIDRLMLLALSIQHQTLGYYHVCSNDDPRLTFDLFTQMSTLVVPYAFVWENA